MSQQTDFLGKVRAGALLCWEKGSILPSITGAQAALETGWGASTLVKEANNLFGIKADANWKGEFVNLPTTEYINGTKKTVTAKFRKYSSWDESIRDRAEFFTSSEWRKNNYKSFIGETDYKKAAKALVTAPSPYATDPVYADKLIAIIEQYGLSEWDKEIKSNNVTTTT